MLCALKIILISIHNNNLRENYIVEELDNLKSTFRKQNVVLVIKYDCKSKK